MRRPKFAALWRRRPRALTLFVLFLVAASIALANLTYEICPARDSGGKVVNCIMTMPFGWPLTWRRCIVFVSPGPAYRLGWQYSSTRLAGNLPMWLVMLVGPAWGCEWLLRRYRPRLRCSLRTLLAAVALAGALCAWIVKARDRANLQDAVLAATKTGNVELVVERWGPKWLDLVGAERYRRQVVGARFGEYGVTLEVEELEEILQRLSRLSGFRYLLLEIDFLSPGMVRALNDMRELRMLSIEQERGYGRDDPSDIRIADECLAAIGNMRQLELLELRQMTIHRESLARLTGLDHLLSLSLIECSNIDGPDQEATPQLLSRLPPLPAVEALDLEWSSVSDDDLRRLVGLPRLKSLNLALTRVTGKGLPDLARLDSLEELRLDDGFAEETFSATELKPLLALERLRKLNMKCWQEESDPDGFHAALEALEASHPGIVIDGRYDKIGERVKSRLRWENERVPEAYRDLMLSPAARYPGVTSDVITSMSVSFQW